MAGECDRSDAAQRKVSFLSSIVRDVCATALATHSRVCVYDLKQTRPRMGPRRVPILPHAWRINCLVRSSPLMT